MYRIKKLMSLLFVSVFLFTVPSFASSEVIPEDQITGEVPNYKVDTVQRKDMNVYVRSSGAQFMSSTSFLYYTGLPVIFEEVLVKNGDYVEKGDPVLKVRSEVSESKIYEAELKVTRLREEKNRNYQESAEEIRLLTEDKDEKESEDEKSIIDLRIQKKNVELQKRSFELDCEIKKAEKELNKIYELRDTEFVLAETSGYVSNIQYFEKDSYIYENTLILTVEQSDNSYLVLPGKNFQYGMNVSLSPSVGGQKFTLHGHVVIAPSALPKSNCQSSVIVLDLTEEEQKMMKKVLSQISSRGGDYSYIVRQIEVEGEAILKNVLVLNRDCKTTESGKNFLQVVDDEGHIHKKLYQEGGSNTEEIWILEGVSEGDRVIIND